MKRLALALIVGLIGVGISIVVFKSINTPRMDVFFQPSAAYNHPINGLSFRFGLTNQSSGLVEVEVLRTETRTTNGWQILTNFSDPELLRFDAEGSADVPLPVGPQTWRAVLRYRKFPGHVENRTEKIGSRVRRVRRYMPAPWLTNFSSEITQ